MLPALFGSTTEETFQEKTGKRGSAANFSPAQKCQHKQEAAITHGVRGGRRDHQESPLPVISQGKGPILFGSTMEETFQEKTGQRGSAANFLPAQEHQHKKEAAIAHGIRGGKHNHQELPFPVISQGKGLILFSLPPDQDCEDKTSSRRKTAIRQSEKTSYIFTQAQLAQLAAAAPSAQSRQDSGDQDPLAFLPIRLISPSVIHPQAARHLASTPIVDAFGPRQGAAAVEVPTQGKPRSLMQPQQLAEVHPFTPTMKQWRHGIKVDCGPDWSWDVIEAAIKRGPHPMACTSNAHDLFKEDIAYQVMAGFSKVMLWEDVKRLRPQNLKIFPVALIPQVG